MMAEEAKKLAATAQANKMEQIMGPYNFEQRTGLTDSKNYKNYAGAIYDSEGEFLKIPAFREAVGMPPLQQQQEEERLNVGGMIKNWWQNRNKVDEGASFAQNMASNTAATSDDAALQTIYESIKSGNPLLMETAKKKLLAHGINNVDAFMQAMDNRNGG